MSETNNPFRCRSIVNEVQCPNTAAYVYASASNVRLLCDTCGAQYQGVKGAMGPPPVAGMSLLELIPAREALLYRNGELERAVIRREAETVRQAIAADYASRRGVLYLAALSAVGFGQIALIWRPLGEAILGAVTLAAALAVLIGGSMLRGAQARALRGIT